MNAAIHVCEIDRGRHKMPLFRLWLHAWGWPHGYWWGTSGRGWLYPLRENMRYYKSYKTKEAALQAAEIAIQCPPPAQCPDGHFPSGPFTLRNDPPPYRPWRGEEPPALRQKLLLEGLDCCGGQMDLFPTEKGGARESHRDDQDRSA